VAAFGSVARDQQEPTWTCDLLVDLPRARSLRERIALKLALGRDTLHFARWDFDRRRNLQASQSWLC